ncbi:MAG: sodium/solute symporter [Myxococcota bacterium]|nr:sodium/solute symporter [Myxococcota bacterium]
MDAASHQLNFTTIDSVIVIVYFVSVLAIGLWISRNTKTGEDLFLAGRSLGWIAIGFSLFASNISSTTLIGLVGAAYTGGLYVSNYEWMATIVLVFFVFFYVPIFLKSRISTIPEYLEMRFGPVSRKYMSGMTIITSLFVDTAGSLYAGAVVLMAFFPQLDLFYTCVGLAIVAGLYTAAGGLAAVVYTDVIQAVVLLAGSVLLTAVVFGHPNIDWSWTTITSNLDASLFSVVNPEHHPLDDPNLPWLGTLLGVPILGFYFWVTNQYIVQRVLGARSLDDARWGALLGGLLKLPVLFIMVLPGLMAKLIFPDLPEADAVFPTMVTQLLPVGVVGLVMAGLIAAIMSSIDSTLNSASALVTLDFVKPARPEMTDKETAWVGRIAMGVIMIFAALWAPQIANFEGLFAYLQELLAYLVPPITVLFIMGVFFKGGSGHTAMFAMAGGHLISIGIFVGQKMEIIPSIHFTLIAAIVFVLSLVIYLATKNMGEARSDEEIVDLIVQKDTECQPGLRSYKLQSAVLIALTLAIVVAFF